MFFCLAATVSQAQGLSGSGTAGDPYVIATDGDYTTFVTMANGGNEAACYQITADVTASGTITAFSGTLEAAINPATHMPYRIKSVTAPMFTTLTGTVRNLTINSVSISSGTNVGAVACTANVAARIYNVGILGGSVGGSNYVGGLVGFLDGTARVVNCYSYADITGGTNVGGIVGYNNQTTTAANGKQKTMVFACMFYGDITGGTNKAPVYNGTNISNAGSNGTSGVSNFNYFRGEASYVQKQQINTYNCALLAEDRFLKRFEFFRHILNGQRQLAGWWATGTYSKEDMLKWVLLPDSLGTDHPYPVLMEHGKYPSVVNIDAEHAVTGKPRNQGGKLGTLAVHIQMGNGAVYNAPAGAAITTTDTTLIITDKDTAHYNFNYYKVQLPYYNDVGTNNYNGNRVVTGWKIVSITGGTPGTYSTGDDVTYTDGVLTATPYNFADRNCTNKDLYSVSGRIFNQGAYWDVPYGVTSITIEPYWAKCVYLADPNADKIYKSDMSAGYDVSNVGGGKIYDNRGSYSIAGEIQKVFTNKGDAIATSNNGLFQGASGSGNHTVYDYAVVLVGNYHFLGSLDADMSKPYTVTSVDLDGDNEPDYSYILRFDSRKAVHPVRVDFINIPGLGMAQKSDGGTGSYNFGIMQPKGWFESTNTSLFRETQFEYDNSARVAAPYILQGGVMEQWVNGQSGGHANKTTYFHVGGNVWFKEFHRGTHQDQTYDANHSPVSVTGGDFDQFYLTGLYRADATIRDDNAECYITGGRFGVVAGTGMDGLGTSDGKGNITWIVDNADIEEFYAGSFNADKPAIGNFHTIVNGGHINLFCGGPKFGDMSSGKTVTTTATGCTFGTFFGAGYGGNSYSRQAPRNHNGLTNFPHNDGQAGNHSSWNAWLAVYYKQDYNSTYGGVSTQFSYQFLPMSGNANNVARIFVDYVKFSLATTHNVTSTLTGCTVTGNFYGGGSLGKVDGDVTSTITDCNMMGNVYGAGFSAALPTVEVDSIGFRTEPYYYTDLGTYRTGVKSPACTTYTWRDTTVTVNSTAIAINKTKHFLYTNEDLSTLGTVSGNVNLTLGGTTTVAGDVYGGAALSSSNTGVDKTTTVTLTGGTYSGNIYGGGQGDADNPVTEGNTIVNIGTAEQPGNNISIAGSVFGCNNVNGTPNGNAAVHVYRTGHTAGVDGVADAGYALPAVFGGGNVANYEPADDKGITVHVHNCDNTIAELYGGGMTANAGTAEKPVSVTVIVDGGRHGDVFSGAKGTALTGADIFGDVELNLRGGSITRAFGGSNTNGNVSGGITVNADDDDEGSCALDVDYVFGGGNQAPYTPTTPGSYPAVNIISGTVNNDVFGGGLGATAIVTSNPVVTVDGGTVSRNVYGGGDAAGVTGNTTVQLNGGSVVGAFGGGNVANITGTTTVTIDGATATNLYGGGNQANVSSTATVNVESGTVGTGIYGGCNSSGTVGGDIEVNIHGGTLTLGQGIFGGGYGSSTSTSGNVTVNIGDEAGTHTPTVTGDIYGGSALGNVNDALADITTVNILNGTVTGGSIYGGGLGDGSHAARVNGTVLVNISNSTQDEEDCHIDLRGVTVYGCNNSNGSPQGDVTVHVWKTGYTTGDYASQTGSLYAIDQVFGGGNQADYLPENGNVNSTKKATVHIHDCKNTIRRVFSGGNAAAATGVANIIEGGRFDHVFGGGNGEETAANIGLGGTTLTVHAGKINYLFGGSNEKGTITGPSATSIDGNNAVTGCDENISNFFGGGNKAPITGDVTTTIDCSTKQIGDIYGGSNKANINGSVTLNIRDGQYDNVFGGSKDADISGNVTVNIFGGDIDNLYGGNNNSGAIGGKITVNVDHNNMQTCPGTPIVLNRIYGGGRNAAYTPGAPYGSACDKPSSPEVNIIHDSVTLYVFGGGYGSTARVTGNTQVNLGTDRPSAWTALGWTKRNVEIGDIVHVHNDVYGGGEAAPVTGNTRVRLNSEAGTPDSPTIVDGSVFGGGLGNSATLNFRYNTVDAQKADTLMTGRHRGWPYTGNTEVDIRGERTLIVGSVYGGGNAGIVYGNTDVIIGDYVPKVVTPAITFSHTWTGSAYEHTAQIVTTTNDANLYYTTDGSDPDEGSSAYSAPFNVTPGAPVKTIGIRDGYTNSDITSVVYRPVSPTPVISYIRDGSDIRLVLTTPAGNSDRIWYRIGGSDPDEEHRTVYNPASKPIVELGDEIRAYALGMNDAGWDLSPVATSTVTAVETPVITVDNEGHVSITCATPGATIRYNHGDAPVADVTEGSEEWPGTLQLTMNQYIKAIAYKEGMACSDQAEGVHSAVTATPVITLGRHGADVMADIACATNGVTLLYRIGGTDPDPANVDEVNTMTFDPYDLPTVTNGQVIKAIAIKSGRNNSAVASATAQIVAKPTIDIDNSGHVTITPAAGSTVHYTTDGNEPTVESPEYTAPFQAANFATVKAAGFRDGYTESDTADKRYVPTVATPTATFQRNGSTIKAMIECTTPGAVIYWSTDGVDPTEGSLRYFPASANVTSGVTLKARAYCAYPYDWKPSAVLTVTVTEAVETPVITVSPDGTSVTNITCATDGATIRYAIGSTVVTEESPIYSGGTISDLGNTTFSTAAFKDGLLVSVTAVKRPVATPLIVIDNIGHVTITCATAGATIKFDDAGYDPDHDHGTVYSGPFGAITPGTTIKAVAFKDGEIISDVSSVSRAAEPVEAPGITVNNSNRYITITPGVRDGVARYTTDGTTPGISASAYTYQFRMPGATIKAITVLDGNLSSVTTIEPVATPTPNRIGTTVTITCVTEGATIYYTTDGTSPNTSSHRYTGPFNATIGDIITAYAVKDGMNVSENSTPLNVTAE